MRKLFLLLVTLCVASVSSINAQSKYFVKFTDKNSSPYSIANPTAFLSQKAIDRRAKENIEITESDIPVNATYVEQLKQLGATVYYTLRWTNGAVVSISSSTTLEQIQSLAFVSDVKEIYTPTKTSSKFKTPQVQKLDKVSKGNANTQDLNYGQSATQVKMINCHMLHNNGYLGDGITIAILDAGFYNANTHSALDSLRTNNQILGTKDFVNPSSNIYQEDQHGMMVLSTMGGYADGMLIGTAPHANFWLIRTEDANSEQVIEEYNWQAGAEFADSVGADIINTSLGYTTFDVESQNHAYSDLDGQTTVITQAANMVAGRGIVVVVSAGNEGNDAWKYISAPADSPNVITVGAVDAYKNKASFSSFGPTADGRTKPDVCAMGQNVVVASPYGGIGTSNGTSFSAPITAGAIACLWQAQPTLTHSEIANLLITTSSNYNTPNNSIGYGIPDLYYAATSSPKIEEDHELRLFPNPFSGNNVTINLPSNHSKVKVEIYEINGVKVYEKLENSPSNNLFLTLPSSIKQGTLIFKITTDSKIYNIKAIKL
ncbi:MAG TPA: S8 family serine peptidase [Tenuifilaceae bacterium]|nr:S8 family serine peptidase [Tenuifilaceae bacterium]